MKKGEIDNIYFTGESIDIIVKIINLIKDSFDTIFNSDSGKLGLVDKIRTILEEKATSDESIKELLETKSGLLDELLPRISQKIITGFDMHKSIWKREDISDEDKKEEIANNILTNLEYKNGSSDSNTASHDVMMSYVYNNYKSDKKVQILNETFKKLYNDLYDESKISEMLDDLIEANKFNIVDVSNYNIFQIINNIISQGGDEAEQELVRFIYYTDFKQGFTYNFDLYFSDKTNFDNAKLMYLAYYIPALVIKTLLE
jgi:hypothetical protein